MPLSPHASSFTDTVCHATSKFGRCGGRRTNTETLHLRRPCQFLVVHVTRPRPKRIPRPTGIKSFQNPARAGVGTLSSSPIPSFGFVCFFSFFLVLTRSCSCRWGPCPSPTPRFGVYVLFIYRLVWTDPSDVVSTARDAHPPQKLKKRGVCASQYSESEELTNHMPAARHPRVRLRRTPHLLNGGSIAKKKRKNRHGRSS